MPEQPAPAGAVRSEARGPHWIAWVPDEKGRPSGAVVLVGRTREEAEDRARLYGASSASSSESRSAGSPNRRS